MDELQETHWAGDEDEGTHTPLPGATGWVPVVTGDWAADQALADRQET